MPNPTTAFAQLIALELFGLNATATALPGEYDANYRLDAANGQRYLLRLSRVGEPREAVTFQNALLAHVASHAPDLAVQKVIPLTLSLSKGAAESPAMILDEQGHPRWARLLTWLPGRVMAKVNPHTPELLRGLGELLGKVDAALVGFEELSAPGGSTARSAELKWNLAKAEWVVSALGASEQVRQTARSAPSVRPVIDHYLNEVQPKLASLPHQITHNDANDYNVLVDGIGYDARVSGLIDFGDAIYTPRVCNLAIALAYAMLGKPDPLASAAHVVAGYHAQNPLREDELAVLWPLAQMRLAVSVINSAQRKLEQPDDPYIVISEAPAWAALEKLAAIHPRFAHYKFRAVCGMEPVPGASAITRWLAVHADGFASVVKPDLRRDPITVLDLSVGSLDMPLPDEIDTTAKFTRKLFAQLDEAGVVAGIGRYDEPRLIYANDDFMTIGENGKEYRTLHVALDVFMPAGAEVFAPLDGVVHSFQDNTARLDYGPCIILEHRVETEDGGRKTGGNAVSGLPSPVFYTLYGHLSRESLEGLRVGQKISKGQRIAWMGDYPINGDWPPHLHFQVITDLLDYAGTYPGVARPSDRAVWQSLCPNPNLICQIPAEKFPALPMREEEILAKRKERVGYNLSLSYRHPLNIVRGQGQYLYDQDGHRFLDGYNNVPHVGHSHPRVVRAAQRQMAALNTNTRYLHENLVRYAERLTATLPAPLSVCFFVSSGSEATELAIRLARAHTGQKDLIVSEGAYHGNTNTLIDVSPYKAEGKGGAGLPAWVHKAALPDVYRGPHRDPSTAGRLYAQELIPILQNIRAAGRGPSGFLIESIPSVGGQIVLPEGYLRECYALVRGADGLCMADEVQTGFGRVGKAFWAFETQGVVPDIVAMGKPIGNGHPMGAVVTTPEIAASFNNGMEYFATFGGNPVSCAVGMAVLDVIEREGLQAHAQELGAYFLAQLRGLQARHSIIGDVRGMGLFLGAELVRDRETRAPAPAQAAYVVNRLAERGILIGTDGLDHNVLKVRGPMCLTRADVDFFVAALDEVLGEEGAK
ncbi:MAG: aminotransferase class III-fold pyridoxal phosphate-dependent enzyme [Anaerolineae bacterium]